MVQVNKDNYSELAKSSFWAYRQDVARAGFALDELVNDKDSLVRAEVAKHGFGLEQLVHDESRRVREAVAEQGYGLGILVNDEEPAIRRAVAKQGYGLEQLSKDEDLFVKMNVAQQGYKVREMIANGDVDFREALAKEGIGLPYLVNDESFEVRLAVAEQGYGLDLLSKDSDSDIRLIAAQNGAGLENLVNDSSYIVRSEVAKQGYGLESLVNDDWWQVRTEVAKQGYGLEQLVNDPSEFVRASVAEQGYGLEQLSKDESWEVQKAVAEQGYGGKEFLENFKDNVDFKIDLAKAGLYQDELAQDADDFIREIVEKNNGTYRNLIEPIEKGFDEDPFEKEVDEILAGLEDQEVIEVLDADLLKDLDFGNESHPDLDELVNEWSDLKGQSELDIADFSKMDEIEVDLANMVAENQELYSRIPSEIANPFQENSVFFETLDSSLKAKGVEPNANISNDLASFATEKGFVKPDKENAEKGFDFLR